MGDALLPLALLLFDAAVSPFARHVTDLMCRLCRLRIRIRASEYIRVCADGYDIASLENMNGG